MEEDEYKSTYNELVSVRCVFEKALTNNQARCGLSKHFCLADREGYTCNNVESSVKCRELLKLLRENSIFVLKLHEIKGPLPHNMELRVQVGGMTGLAKLVTDKAESPPEQAMIEDINRVLNKAIEKFVSLENLPFSEIVQSVEQFQGRRSRQR